MIPPKLETLIVGRVVENDRVKYRRGAFIMVKMASK